MYRLDENCRSMRSEKKLTVRLGKGGPENHLNIGLNHRRVGTQLVGIAATLLLLLATYAVLIS